MNEGLSPGYTKLISGRPVILGHRGAPGLAQENSLDSFRMALKGGADGVELDVHRTSDGELIVYHDANLSDGTFIEEHDLEEVRRAAQRQRVIIHTLEEVLREISGMGIINIEIKRSGFEESCIHLARRLLPAETYLFSSFLPEVVAACRRFAPDVPSILIRVEPGPLDMEHRLLQECDASGVAFHHTRIDPMIAQFFKTVEIPLFTWTVNDVDEARRMEALGIAGIITDCPGDLVASLRTNSDG